MKFFFIIMIALIAFNTTFSQTDSAKTSTPVSPAPAITGSVDVYYRYNFANPKTGVTNNLSRFTNSQNSFELGMASIKADHSFGKASAIIDLGFGRRAEEFSYGNPDHSTLFAVKQAYVSYAVTDKIKLTMGKWATHIGYEVPDAYLNRNYSMDYMFSYGPFSHTGLKADIGLGKKNAFMIGVANTTDHASDTLSRKYAIAQFSTGTANNKIKLYINYQGSYGGSFNTSQFDVVLNAAVTSMFSIGYNGTAQTTKQGKLSAATWFGSAIYLSADPTTVFGITLRAEYFDNKKAVVSAPATSIFDITLSPNFRISNLTVIPELRLDTGKDEIFEKNDGSITKSTFTGLLAATYHF